ncbi:hypothetical protein [Pontibacter chitinilyticus]|uniref:hypothetical protein n=1 Tax=Pontibacter chitinilyticus TaxID=2674989 RepID=UPI00321BE553
MKQLATTGAVFIRKRICYLFILLLGFVSVSCSPDDLGDLFGDITGAKSIPDSITVTNVGLYPEGVSHDALNHRFLISSVSTGVVGTVSYKGDYKPFITDNRLISSIGLKVDEARKRVLVAGADPGGTPNSTPATAGQTALLGIYDLATGAPLYLADLGALRPGMPHFANDVALDKQGNAYVTDSYSPIIYKVDSEGHASVFFEDEDFATPPGAFGFNGIAYHADGFLLVNYSAENAVYKIPLSDPANLSKVTFNAPLEAPDGLLLSPNGKQLIVVNNAGGAPTGRVLSFKSTDNWQSGNLTESFVTGPEFPTTATGYGNAVFVLYAHLDKLFGGAQSPQEKFTIRKVPFTKNEDFGK